MGEEKVPCPKCGQPKAAQAKQCLDWYKASRQKWSGVCRVPDCDTPARYKGTQLCSKHHERLKRNGDVNRVEKLYRQPQSTCVIGM